MGWIEKKKKKIRAPINREGTRKTIPRLFYCERRRQFVEDSKSITEIKASIKPIVVRNHHAPWESKEEYKVPCKSLTEQFGKEIEMRLSELIEYVHCTTGLDGMQWKAQQINSDEWLAFVTVIVMWHLQFRLYPVTMSLRFRERLADSKKLNYILADSRIRFLVDSKKTWKDRLTVSHRFQIH
ncbi:hypothetical protein CEXT_567551 [Caerostris extrusa]|uniref:Transposase n=1 Tax=Caerostris extrusa TaxID=172846 RepID=A0AAV4NA29_CAEEX|nr:hypothetical protein CEXT_567551 [Caerostris extrusa]